MSNGMFILSLAALAAGVLLAVRRVRRYWSHPYPPGPKGYPVIGNALDLPTSLPWKTYTAWKEKFGEEDQTVWGFMNERTIGDIIYVSVLGQPLVILSTPSAARDLLEKRAHIYSDRPASPMGHLTGFDRTTALTPYSSEFRQTTRRITDQFLAPKMISSFRPSMESHTTRLLRRLASTPEDFGKHVHYYVCGVILDVTYGYDVKEDGDPFVKMVEDFMDDASWVLQPGKWLVDFFPPLRYLPDWVPGARFKTLAREIKARGVDIVRGPYGRVKEELGHGKARSSFVSNRLSSTMSTTPEEDEKLLWAALSMYGGGVETSTATLQIFFLAMALNPVVQKKAQEEIDRLVDTHRLPSFEDKDQLIYVNALVHEVLRWQPVAPLGFPHRLTEEDEYGGRAIPKGSFIFTNTYAISRDPDLYPEPERFMPERFLDKDVVLPRTFVYGHGRRICPGIQFVDQSVFLAVARILALFEIKPVEGEKPPSFVPITGLIVRPAPFRCVVTVRSEARVQLLDVLEAGRK